MTLELNTIGQKSYLFIFNMLGQQVKSIPLVSTHSVLDMNDLTEGVYIYQVIRDNKPAGTGRLVIQK
jgi:hypothetical protein